jgi:hypothetical protein
VSGAFIELRPRFGTSVTVVGDIVGGIDIVFIRQHRASQSGDRNCRCMNRKPQDERRTYAFQTFGIHVALMQFHDHRGEM